MKRGGKLIILSQTVGMDGYHGTVGTPTNMLDTNGEPLFVGDLVTVHSKESDKTVHFVCEENHKYAKWTSTERQYVMGIASIWNSNTFKKANLSASDEDFYEKMDDLSKGWVVKKVKDFKDLVIGEHWGFLYVREVDEV